MKKEKGILTSVEKSDLFTLRNNPKKFWKGVTKIGPFAFDWQQTLKEIEIPEGITEIQDCAFQECGFLKKVILPKSLIKIESEAFENCNALSEIEIPNSTKYIGRYAFHGCTSLSKMILPEGLSGIGENAFKNCSALEEVQIPGSLKEVSDYAFRGCESLKKIKLNEGLERIGVFAFGDCNSLREIELPSTVKEIEQKAFAYCSNLHNIKLPEGMTEIQPDVFIGCISLEEVDIPDSVKVIQESAFTSCRNLKKVKLPKGLVKIGKQAFTSCRALEELEIPNTVLEIGNYAFANSYITKINLPDSLQRINFGIFKNCTELEEIDIPNTVSTIGVSAFENCTNLSRVKLPNNISIVDTKTFERCISLEEIKIPETVIGIGHGAFSGCSNLKEINLPDGLIAIGDEAFSGCFNLTSLIIPESVKGIGQNAFSVCNNLQLKMTPNNLKVDKFTFYATDFEYIYMSPDGKNLIFSPTEDKSFEGYVKREFSPENANKFLDDNFRNNFTQLHKWKKEGKIKFVPPEYTMEVFPADQLKKYFLHNNNQRWGQLVKTLKFDTLEGDEKNNSLTDLMKIYYAIGGFSENQGESEKAFKYVLEHVAKSKNPHATPSEIGSEIHSRFSKLKITEAYNPIFAKFFMKYYHKNPDFMVFELEDKDGGLMKPYDYLCMAHNSFETILKNYPNRVVNGNEERALLTPRFVAENSIIIEYDYVDEGNEKLAQIVGRYGYSQDDFEHIQSIYNRAKILKDKYVICADKASGKEGITFRLLEKDDPLGFVLGDITNCCQHIGGAGGSCVDDGYVNPNAGFLVFEEMIFDDRGKPTGDKRILGQAYVWYDPETKTVCYDNIEIPTKVLDELRSGYKTEKSLSTTALMNAVVESANAIMFAMNRKGIKVDRITTGKGYNDLKDELSQKFGEPEENPIAQHRDYVGYSDAKKAQYIIQTYDKLTKEYAVKIAQISEEIKADLDMVANHQSQPKMEA